MPGQHAPADPPGPMPRRSSRTALASPERATSRACSHLPAWVSIAVIFAKAPACSDEALASWAICITLQVDVSSDGTGDLQGLVYLARPGQRLGDLPQGPWAVQRRSGWSGRPPGPA